MPKEWLQVLITVGVTILLGLVAAIWIMLKERITLHRQDMDRRFDDLGRQHEADHRKIDKEIESLRKARHNLVDRLSAVETFIKFFVVKKRPAMRQKYEDEDGDDPPEL